MIVPRVHGTPATIGATFARLIYPIFKTCWQK